MTGHKTFPALIVALAAGFAMAPAAGLAQTQAPEEAPAEQQQVPQPPAAEDIDPSDEQLQAFATATVRIARIQQEAQQEMQSAVEDSGLTIDEYNAIAQKAQTDQQISEQVRGLIDDEIGG